MKALALLAATAAAALAPYSFSPAAAQGPRGGPGGSFQGAPSSGGSFRGGPSSRGGPGYSAPHRGSGSNVRVHGPAVWWGPGVWRSPGVWHGGWWGPAWRGGWWGPPVGWSTAWWGPGPWPGAWWGHGAWAGGWWGPGVWVSSGPAPVVAAPSPVFIERDPPAAPVWWYWCDEANAYYPYVKECPGEWRRVPPQPVPPTGSTEGGAK